MAEQRVVILGDTRIDEIRDPGGMRESVGGDAVELADALRGHGLALTIVAPVGEDSDGERIRTVLQDRGIRLVVVPAPEGTPRRSLVRDRSGAEVELRRGGGAFSDTRRSLAAQAEADVIVDLRQGIESTVAEERDAVLRALGLADAPEEPVREGGASAAPGTSRPLDVSTDATTPAPDAATAATRSDDASVAGAAVSAAPSAAAPPAVLLPAPIVAGTVRHAPVRLIPEPLVAHAPAQDWHGLEARLARIAT
ncbi:hypothetical protein [Microbacterium azadirachtae]|uniref:hypothetical protein n=1 Tax=Microbacterium azadirachtae TaxID=582680 RepID=UPI00088FE7A7|nr:hypothetical protein [Microbacterium azadirachtae]SDL83959.1 hypothetical protein SAMN04488593_1883 [Microbacterium azadirachtae]SEG22842.1 hypothetical protein SAMN04488594_2296 [Microbacterium azadirachtae]SEG25223.1 hypothetical protein SAMN04488592_2306 [Microbacterium azadirachtae]